MKNLNKKYADIIRERFEENIKSGNDAVRYMENSTAIYRGEAVACLYMPKIFSREAYEFLQKAASDICGILDKVIERYLSDAEYRKLFPFEKELEELILTKAGYSRLLPIARLDIFFNEEDFSFKFCEFNADGASSMNEDREINAAIAKSDAFIEFNKEHKLQSFELFDSWVREFVEIAQPPSKNFNIAIVDIIENTTPNEFVEFQKAFQRAGYLSEICDIRGLVYENGELKSPDGKKIDAIYRRAVTCDIMEHRDSVQAFLQAARDNAVCIIGHFRTQIIHNKAVFKILRMPETLSFLTEYEREYVMRHIPETFSLSSETFQTISREDVLKNKNDWIIKPEDLYASHGVFVGVDMSAEEWEKAVTNATDTCYLLQRFCTPYKSENLDFNSTPQPKFELYNNLTGLFVYNGKLAGLYSRAGQMGMISSGMRGLTLASVVEDY
ncbi:MAG: glutathionylspermidine synthase family protein [Defluviitaleaceae bacterium]|nr:glutathionylspermidine synthase family protein [Defluviitaleaceae bacterium]